MRILIADGQGRVRFALRVLLAQQSGLLVVGEAAGFEELLALAPLTEPDVVLIDWELPGLRDGGGLPALRRVCPSLRIVVLSGNPGVRQAVQAAGGDTFVSKGEPPDRLLAVVRRRGAAA